MLLEAIASQTGLHGHDLRDFIERDDPVHRRGLNDQRSRQRGGAAAYARPQSASDDRHAGLVAPAQDAGDLLRALGKDHRRGQVGGIATHLP